MRLRLFKSLFVTVISAAFCGAGALAQEKPSPPASERSQPDPNKRAESYYHFTMGHLYEEFYEATNQSEYANQAIEFYKKAYQLDPKTPVIGERLAEIYFKAQRIKDAVLEAQEIIRRDPDNVAGHRLLARIYTRSLGDTSAASGQREIVNRAIEQYREILRIDPSDSEAAIWLARLYRLENEPEKAGAVLRRLLEREPENEAAVTELTKLLKDMGKSSEALSLLESVEKRSPSPGVLALLGQGYLDAHQPARAEQVFRRAVELEPSEETYRQGLAQALAAQEKLGPALEQYQKLTELRPDEPDAYLQMAQAYRQLHQLDRAEESVLRAKQRAPGSLEVIYSEAGIYEAQGRFDDAIRVLSDAVAAVKGKTTGAGATPGARRTLAILYERLGRVYREVEKYPAALSTFQEMLKLGEEEERRARVLIADTYHASRDIAKAVEESRKALNRYPNDRTIRVTHALILGEAGEINEAAALLRAMLSGSGDDREIYLDLAQLYERGRRYADAEQAARAAEKLASRPADNEMVWFVLGAIFERQKKYDLAEDQFKRVLEVNPRNAPALNYYGYMLADLGTRLSEATTLVQRALAEEPQNGAYLDSLGWAYFKQNRLSDAEGSLRQAAARNTHDPTIRDHLGDVYFKTGRIELAAAEWERALAEWRQALPSEHESDKVAQLEQKLLALRNRLAQQKSNAISKP